MVWGNFTLTHILSLVALNNHYAAIGSETVANYMFSVQPSNPLLAVYALQLLAEYRKKA